MRYPSGNAAQGSLNDNVPLFKMHHQEKHNSVEKETYRRAVVFWESNFPSQKPIFGYLHQGIRPPVVVADLEWDGRCFSRE